MPCKYDSLMGTAQTQIPKAIANGAVLLDNATVVRVEISNKKATGVTYVRNGVTTTVNARKLVVLSAGAIGTPAILYSSGVWNLNKNVGQYLRAHPGVAMDALVPGTNWNTDRGYQWNCYHYPLDDQGQPYDVIIHASAGFPAATPWVAAQVGFFGSAYKDLMRRYPQRIGTFHFQLKPAVYGKVMGGVDKPIIQYPVSTVDGVLEPKLLNDLTQSITQAARIFREMGAITTFPNPNEPPDIFKQEITQLVTTAGALHPQGTCRAGASRVNSVVDKNCLSFDIDNLMCCDASVIPHHISSNPNAMIMSIGARCGDFVRKNILNTPSGKLTAEGGAR
jgi:choline dehydrogenase